MLQSSGLANYTNFRKLIKPATDNFNSPVFLVPSNYSSTLKKQKGNFTLTVVWLLEFQVDMRGLRAQLVTS